MQYSLLVAAARDHVCAIYMTSCNPLSTHCLWLAAACGHVDALYLLDKLSVVVAGPFGSQPESS